jgi:hypothetical protein
MRRQGAERAAINALRRMRGTATDLIKLAMIAVQRWLEPIAQNQAHYAGPRRIGAPKCRIRKPTGSRTKLHELMCGVAKPGRAAGGGRWRWTELGKSALTAQRVGAARLGS